MKTPLLFPICFWSFFFTSVPLLLVQVGLKSSLAKSIPVENWNCDTQLLACLLLQKQQQRQPQTRGGGRVQEAEHMGPPQMGRCHLLLNSSVSPVLACEQPAPLYSSNFWLFWLSSISGSSKPQSSTWAGIKAQCRMYFRAQLFQVYLLKKVHPSVVWLFVPQLPNLPEEKESRCVSVHSTGKWKLLFLVLTYQWQHASKRGGLEQGSARKDQRSWILLLQIGLLRTANKDWHKAVLYILRRFFSSSVHRNLRHKMPTKWMRPHSNNARFYIEKLVPLSSALFYLSCS